MTNAEKFEEVFGIKINEFAPDFCDTADPNICRGPKWCSECILNNFWLKEYKDNKNNKNKNVWYECECEKCEAKIFARDSQIKRYYDIDGVLHEYIACSCGNLIYNFKKSEREVK